ncbi:MULTISPECIES: ATP-binding protein [Streptomyces]|uniref:ATP-binding protein n=1 Tax=Streptomyces TaxID=1883 RepID=UPI00211B4D6C|nr:MULTISPECIES: ATP-binding protein [Streptomyces]MDX3580978.1 ATP-binding protein [Streptomyces europaeiscabiei]MDX3631088.1 ATP-binding protein [Streptomyces europaeiscabiei]MDX3648898.1 ATP-binding protein [Streptomyces europaeiscabiei]WUD37562.1 ATP-binding protein [Streptomyces europaeiscabiei]
MSEKDVGYDAAHIEVLEGRDAIRKRPGMYVGSTGERGLYQMLFEVADRAVNEVVAGRAGSVDVVLTADGGVRVADDGPGLPVEAAGHTGGPGLETLLTGMTTRESPDNRHAVHLGLFGIGPFVTNALSSRLTAEVRRDGVRWVQEYTRGVAVTRPTAAGPTTRSGTTIAFWPDADVFETVQYSSTVLADRFRELAFLNRGLDISFTDERSPGESRSARFRFPGGTRDFVAFLDSRTEPPVHPDVITIEREDPRMAGTVEVALRWCAGHEEQVRSFANSRPTHEGGTHVAGFRDGLAAAVDAYARRRHLLTAADPDLDADRIGEGLTAVVSVKLDRTEFSGATRSRLDGAEVRACVAEAVRENLGTWLETHPEQATAVIDRIVRGLPGLRG